jgi:FMN phosphatase YigB (HAD superfamily)
MRQTLKIPESGRVILDCDDVVLDWLPGFTPFAERQLGRRLDGGPGGFDLAGWLQISPEETRALVRAFNEGEDTGFEALPPIEGAIEAVRAMRAQGLELHVLTSCSRSPEVRLRRMDNLDAVFGAGTFAEVICVDLGEPKDAELARHQPSLFVDDLPKNVLAGHRLGHHACLLEAHHNRGGSDPEMEAEGLLRYRDWADVIDDLIRSPEPADIGF